jgi:hypothetical protein
MQASGNLLPPTLFICHPERESKDPALALFPAIPSAFVEERPFRAASERLSERALAPEIRKASDSSKALHHLIICHPERRAKKRSARARVEGPLHSRLPTLASGHPHVPSMIELLAVCKRRGTCCRLPYLFVILSAAKHSRLALFRCHPEPACGRAALQGRVQREERRALAPAVKDLFLPRACGRAAL